MFPEFSKLSQSCLWTRIKCLNPFMFTWIFVAEMVTFVFSFVTEIDNQRVIVRIKDVNDELPYFINRPLPMLAVVKLNAPLGTPVYKLQARDPDTDANIHYFLVRDFSKCFIVFIISARLNLTFVIILITKCFFFFQICSKQIVLLLLLLLVEV